MQGDTYSVLVCFSTLCFFISEFLTVVCSSSSFIQVNNISQFVQLNKQFCWMRFCCGLMEVQLTTQIHTAKSALQLPYMCLIMIRLNE